MLTDKEKQIAKLTIAFAWGFDDAQNYVENFDVDFESEYGISLDDYKSSVSSEAERSERAVTRCLNLALAAVEPYSEVNQATQLYFEGQGHYWLMNYISGDDFEPILEDYFDQLRFREISSYADATMQAGKCEEQFESVKQSVMYMNLRERIESELVQARQG